MLTIKLVTVDVRYFSELTIQVKPSFGDCHSLKKFCEGDSDKGE